MFNSSTAQLQEFSRLIDATVRPHVLYLRQHRMLLLTRDGLYKCVCEAIVRPEVMFSVGVNSVEVECQYLCLVKPRMIYFCK